MRSARDAVDCARSGRGAAMNKIARQSAAESWIKRRLVPKIESSRKNGWTCALLGARESLAGMQIFKLDVQNWIFAPVFVVEMPPFVLVDDKALGLHGTAEKIAMPALQRGAAGIIGKGARRHFIVSAGHFDGFARGEIVEREVDGATAVVT